MGVDNSGILFLGLEDSEVDVSLLPDYKEEDCVYLPEYLESWGEEHDIPLKTQNDNGYNMNFRLVGFEIADSGSYSWKEMSTQELLDKVALYTTQFVQLFGKHPKVYILNYQS